MAVNQALAVMLLAWVLVYLYLALRRAFRRPPGKQVLAYAGLLVLYALVLIAGSIGAAWALI